MCVCTHACVRRAEDNLWELILPNMWGLSIRLRSSDLVARALPTDSSQQPKKFIYSRTVLWYV